MKLRKHLLMFLTFVLAITAVLGLVFVPVNSVKAEEAEAFDFGVKSSVSIRGGKGEGLNPANEVGIRFHVEIAPSYYETISANENFAFGVLIGPKEYYDYIKGDFKVGDEYLADISYVNKDWVFTDENLNANGNYEYVASVLYNRDTLVADIEEELAKDPNAYGGETNVDALVKCAYAKKLVAVPYVVYSNTVEGEVETTTIYKSVSKATSATHVANAGLLSGKVSMNLASRYLNKVVDIDGLFIEEDGTLVGAFANEFTLADNASSISIAGSFEALDTSFRTIDTLTDERGIVKFNNDAFANQTRELGAYYQLSVYDKFNNVYRLNYQYVTNAIENADEFINIFAWDNTQPSEKIDNGYYVLADNIDATGKIVDRAQYTVNTTNPTTFTGTFDGQGHVISNLTIARNDSLFQSLGDGAVIKNYALDNLKADGAKLVSTKTTANTYVRNIYIKYAEGSTDPIGLYYNSSTIPWTDNFVIDYGSNNPVGISAEPTDGKYTFTNGGYFTSLSTLASPTYSFYGLGALYAGPTNFPGGNKHISNFVIFSEHNVPLQWANTSTPNSIVYSKNVKYDPRGYDSEDYLITNNAFNATYYYASYSRSYKDRAAMAAAIKALEGDEEAYKAEFETGGGSAYGFTLKQFNSKGEGCWKMVDGVPYWAELYTKASATVGGVEVLTSSLELTSSEDEVKLSFTNNDQELNVMSGEELQEGEYKAECFSNYLTLTKNEDNTYSVKLAKKVGLTQNAIITLTALIDGVEVERTVKIKLNASSFVLDGTLNGEALSETITLTSDSDALCLGLLSPYDSQKYILNKDNKLEDGEYEFAVDNNDLKKISLVANDDNTISIQLNPEGVQSGLFTIKFTANVDDFIVEKSFEFNVALPDAKTFKGRALLDTSTGELYYDGQLVEGLTYACYSGETSLTTTLAGFKAFTIVDGQIDRTATRNPLEVRVYKQPSNAGAYVGFGANQYLHFIGPERNANNSLTYSYNIIHVGNKSLSRATGRKLDITTAGGTYALLDFTPVSKVLKTAEDLAVFNTADSEGNLINKTNNGCYVLLNDIDATNFKPTHYAGIIEDVDVNGKKDDNYGFSGILDGNGFAIKNLDLTPTPTVLDNPETEEDETFYGNPGVGLFGYAVDILLLDIAFIDATTNYSYLLAYNMPERPIRDAYTHNYNTSITIVEDFEDAATSSPRGPAVGFRDVYVRYSNATQFPLGFTSGIHGAGYQFINVIVEAPGLVSHTETDGVWSTVKTSKMANTTFFGLIRNDSEAAGDWHYYPSIYGYRGGTVSHYKTANRQGTGNSNTNVYMITNANVVWANNDSSPDFYTLGETKTYDGKYLAIALALTGEPIFVNPTEDILAENIFGYIEGHDFNGTADATYKNHAYYGILNRFVKYDDRSALTTAITDFSAFSTKCWTITANGPVWKGLAE